MNSNIGNGLRNECQVRNLQPSKHQYLQLFCKVEPLMRISADSIKTSIALWLAVLSAQLMDFQGYILQASIIFFGRCIRLRIYWSLYCNWNDTAGANTKKMPVVLVFFFSFFFLERISVRDISTGLPKLFCVCVWECVYFVHSNSKVFSTKKNKTKNSH